MKREELKKLLKISKYPVEKINAIIGSEEAIAHQMCMEVLDFADKRGIYCTVDERSASNRACLKAVGVFGDASYSSEFKDRWPTSRRKNKSVLWYVFRDSIYGCHHIINAVDMMRSKNVRVIRMQADISEHYKDLDLVVLKEYKNGNVDYEYNDSVVWLVQTVRAIYRNFNPSHNI